MGRCPTSPWELGVSWAGSLREERVNSPPLHRGCVHPCLSWCGQTCSDILLQAELLQWHEDLAELLALALGLVCDSLMPDLSPPSTSGVLGVQGRILCGAGVVLILCCRWAQPSPAATSAIASGSGKSGEIWTLLASTGGCQVPSALPAGSAEGGSSLGLNFCLCYRRQRLCSGRVTLSPHQGGSVW